MDDVESYLRKIELIPALSVEQEQKLAVLAAAGEQPAIDALAEAHLKLAADMAQDFTEEHSWKGIELLDAVQKANNGLLLAARKYRPQDYSGRFADYARWWIKNSLQEML